MIKKTRKIDDYKGIEKKLDTLMYTSPEFVYIPLNNSRSKTYTLDVKEGDHVKLGQVIGVRNGGFFDQPIHSTVSGEVVSTQKKFHRTGRKVDCLVIKNDFKDTYADSVIERTDEDIYKLTKDEVVEILKQNSIIGLGGSGFPTYIKLATKEKIDTVIINAVECEPYLNSDYRLILDQFDKMFKGLQFVVKALGAKRGIIALKETKEYLYNLLTFELKKSSYNIEVVKVGNYYPQGWELEMIKNAVGIEIPPGELPLKYGVLGINSTTSVAIHDALKYNLPVIDRYFLFSGDAIKEPKNFVVRVGTPVKDLLEKVGGYNTEDKKVFIAGGPMMGTSLVSDDLIVTKAASSVLVFKEEIVKEDPCVRCGSCVYSCPVGIQPVQIMNAVKTKNKEALKKLKVNTCIECGLCSYTCTSKIHLTEYCRKGKRLIK